MAQRNRGWRLLRDQCRRQRGGLALGIAAGLIWTAAKVSVPKLVESAIDHGIGKSDTHAIWKWAIIIAIAGLFSGTFTGLRRYFAFREARWSEAELRQRMFGHLQQLHFAYHDGQQTGQLMSRSNTDLQQIVNFVVMIPLTCANLATVIAAVVLMLRMDVILTLLAVGSLPLLNVLAKRFSTRLHPAVMAVQQESAELAAVVEETVSGVRVVKGFGAEELMQERLGVEAGDLYDASMDTARIRARYLPLLDLLPSIGLILVLAYGGHRVLDHHLTIGALVAFNFYVTLLIWPLRMLGSIIAQAQRAAASAERVDEVLSADVRVTDPARPKGLPAAVAGRPVGAIEFDHVTFGFGHGDPVLHDLDLRIEPGESVALVGATGSGKSTVAKLLPRFYDVDEGRVLLDGVDVRDAAVHEVRRAVGIVFEDTFLFSDSIAANIAFAYPNAPMERIVEAAKLAGAHDFITAMPEGYDTEIGERGFSLSGGQRQRIAIARAILADPRVLILDDATSAVDPSKEREIRDALGEVMVNRTTIVIAHRPATIALADRVVLLDAGRVAAQGTHAELLTTSERYREVLAAAAAYQPESEEVAS
ncbi:MAG TPA: ABC transporter ATP-binding protein [Acidimicrobiales bacterium]|nr:ABC transporter ATP-binding protein [Acidimicrobiales bacterium]